MQDPHLWEDTKFCEDCKAKQEGRCKGEQLGFACEEYEDED